MNNTDPPDDSGSDDVNDNVPEPMTDAICQNSDSGGSNRVPDDIQRRDSEDEE